MESMLCCPNCGQPLKKDGSVLAFLKCNIRYSSLSKHNRGFLSISTIFYFMQPKTFFTLSMPHLPFYL